MGSTRPDLILTPVTIRSSRIPACAWILLPLNTIASLQHTIGTGRSSIGQTLTPPLTPFLLSATLTPSIFSRRLGSGVRLRISRMRCDLVSTSLRQPLTHRKSSDPRSSQCQQTVTARRWFLRTPIRTSFFRAAIHTPEQVLLG